MLSGRTTTTVSAPAHGPLDYNSIRPSFGQLAPLFGLTLLTLLPIGVGGWLLWLSWPAAGEVGGLNLLGLSIGALATLAGIRFFWPLSAAVPDAIKQYHAMIYAWHEAELTKYEQSDGRVTAHQISEWAYNETDMRHVSLLMLWLLVEQPKSLSIERLTRGPILLNVGHRSYNMMEMTQDGAASFLNLLARSGVIVGRGDRKAGTIAMLDPRAAALKVLAEAGRNPAVIGEE